MFYTPGHKMTASYQAETTNLTTLDATAAGTGVDPILPASLTSGYTLLGQMNSPDIVKQDGAAKGRGAGSPYALYDKVIGKTYDATVNVRPTAANMQALLTLCRMTTEATGAANGLPEFALAMGYSAVVDVWRYCVCNQFSVQYSEGADSEFAMTMGVMGVYETTPITLGAVPALADYQALGAPYNWHNMTDFTIGGGDYRKHIGGISFTVNHDVERKGFRDIMVGDGAAASRCAYELMPRTATCSGELTFHKELLRTSNTWGNIVMTIGARTLTLQGVIPSQRHQSSVEPGQQLGWTVPFEFDYFTVS